jgi:DNA-binding protein HU-beta
MASKKAVADELEPTKSITVKIVLPESKYERLEYYMNAKEASAAHVLSAVAIAGLGKWDAVNKYEREKKKAERAANRANGVKPVAKKAAKAKPAVAVKSAVKSAAKAAVKGAKKAVKGVVSKAKAKAAPVAAKKPAVKGAIARPTNTAKPRPAAASKFAPQRPRSEVTEVETPAINGVSQAIAEA